MRLPRTSPRYRLSPWSTPALVVIAVAITFLVTSGPILLAGANPIAAYAEFVVIPLTSRFTLLEVLVSATPILFTGAAVAIAFRAGYWNIGAEGQLLLRALPAPPAGAAPGAFRDPRGRGHAAAQPGGAAPGPRPAPRPVARSGDRLSRVA